MSPSSPPAEPPADDGMLYLMVLSPEKVIFEGKVKAMSCVNVEGPLDILPYHTNFISLIYDALTIQLIDGTIKTIPVGDSLLKQEANTITVLTNIKLNEYDEVIEGSKSSPTAS